MATSNFNLSQFIGAVREDSLARVNRFEVFINAPKSLTFKNKSNAGAVSLYCEMASLPPVNISTKSFKIFGPTYQRPFSAEYGGEGISLTFHVDRDMQVKKFFDEWPIDKTLVTNEYAKFSIQPTITQKKLFQQLVQNLPPMNIWEFEKAIVSTGRDYMVKVGGERKRGLYHYDSLVFPYTATAINKGKWNMSEYSKELNEMFLEHNINPFERGIV